VRLGGPLFAEWDSPEGWIEAVRAKGYRAASCPVGPEADDDEVQVYVNAAREADIVIAEVGAWSNTISVDEQERRAAIEKCKAGLDLADRVGACCCVNISGSRGEQWDGPYADNLTDETFELIVEVVRDIIDSVGPTRTYYTLETMPWTYPDSADSYERLVRAIDRERFAVHLDPVNLVNSPKRYFHTGDLLRECFAKLGPYIRSCHAKDTTLSGKLTVHLDECCPGTGGLDYAVYLTELSKLGPDVPLMLEHLSSEEEYQLAADHIRSVGHEQGLSL
jgi:sugar phosphate isomerase/epimerase